MRCNADLPFALRILPPRIRPCVVLCAVILVHIPLGSRYMIGNLVPYIESYRYGVLHKVTSAGEMSWFLPCLDLTSGLFGVIGGVIDCNFGPRTSVLLGSMILTVGVTVTKFTLQTSLLSMYLSYAACFGAGCGLCSSSSLACVIRWFPTSRGLATGIVSFGFALSPLALSLISTYYINPSNEPADLQVEDLMLFRNTGVLERTPHLFLWLGGIYGICQAVGMLFICNPVEMEYRAVEGSHENTKPSAVIKMPSFHVILLIMGCNVFGMVFTLTFYKSFGSLFIQDDHFLSLTGSISFAANAIGRLFWGRIADHFSYQDSVVFASAGLAIIFFTIELSHYLKSKAAFFVYVMCFNFFMSSTFLHAKATADIFGQKYFASNFALVMLAPIVAATLAAGLATGLLKIIHYSGFYLISGALSTVAFVAGMFFHRT